MPSTAPMSCSALDRASPVRHWTRRETSALVRRCKRVAGGIRLQCAPRHRDGAGKPWALKPDAYGIELSRRTFTDYLDAHAPGSESVSGTVLGCLLGLSSTIREATCRRCARCRRRRGRRGLQNAAIRPPGGGCSV